MKLPRPKISFRMRTFIEHAIVGGPFWDVCCDHGYVGIRALESNLFSEVYFVDQVPHIMNRLETLLEQSRKTTKEHKYFFYTQAGQDIESPVHGTLLIAGVGGLTIKTILASLIERKILHAKRLLLSPHTDELVLIDYLATESFQKIYQTSNKILIPEGKRHRALYILDLQST